MSARRLLPLFGAIVLALAAPAAQAQAAQRLTTLVNGFPPGGASDLAARAMQADLAAALGMPVIVKNVPGAGGAIGAAEVARARGDGQTLLFTLLGSIVSQPHLRKLDYGIDSFAPVCMWSDSPQFLLTTKSSSFGSVKDLVEAARAAPGRIPYASLGTASFPHLITASFARTAGIELLHVPFKGAAQAIQAMLAGELALIAEQPSIIVQYDMRPLAVFTAQRVPEFPQVPTMRELGYDLVYQTWGGIFAPASTPPEIVARLDQACAKSLASPTTLDGLKRLRVTVRYMDSAEFTRFVRAEFERYGRLFKALDLKQLE